jgi:metal-sulfur cluster biosynthetic enzyme
MAAFDRSDVLAWLKQVLDVSISAEDLDLGLVRLKLADQIPSKLKGGKRNKRSKK